MTDTDEDTKWRRVSKGAFLGHKSRRSFIEGKEEEKEEEEEEPFLLASSTQQMCDPMSMLHQNLQICGCDFSKPNMFEGEVERLLAETCTQSAVDMFFKKLWHMRAVSLESKENCLTRKNRLKCIVHSFI